MANIANLASGASDSVMFSYVIKEGDIGNNNITTLITALTDGASANTTSTPLNVEAIRRTLSMSVSIASTPADGKAYGKDETVKFSLVVLNTGNQTLTNVNVTSVTSGGGFESGSGYTVSGTTATIAALGIGVGVTINGTYTVKQSDLGKTDLKVTFQAASGTASVQQTSGVIAVKAAVPTTEAEFASLSWAEIKKYADQCAESGTQDFTHLLGFGKRFEVSGYGTVTVRLKSLNNKTKTTGGKAGFCFESDDLLVTQAQSSQYTSQTLWRSSDVRTLLNGTIFNSLPSDLRAVISEVANECITAAATGSNNPGTSAVNDKCWVPSYKEIFGTTYSGTSAMSTVPNEGTQFDWYVSHNTDAYRVKNKINGSANAWWLRTPYTSPSSNSYGFRSITYAGIAYYYNSNNTLGVPLCFCI